MMKKSVLGSNPLFFHYLVKNKGSQPFVTKLLWIVQVNQLVGQKEDLLRKSIEKRLKSIKLDEEPPNDFREMATYPTSEEINLQGKPYLRYAIV